MKLRFIVIRISARYRVIWVSNEELERDGDLEVIYGEIMFFFYFCSLTPKNEVKRFIVIRIHTRYRIICVSNKISGGDEGVLEVINEIKNTPFLGLQIMKVRFIVIRIPV